MAVQGAGAAAALFLLWAVIERVRASRLAGRAAALQAEVDALKSAPLKQEFRMDRFEVLWFPTVTASEAGKVVTQVVPGLPHCKSCVASLTLAADHSFSCGRCGAKFAASLADVFVTDSVSKDAVKFFQERHPGFRVELKK